jgi:uncharacterized protein YbjT (DUF2867 family)
MLSHLRVTAVLAGVLLGCLMATAHGAPRVVLVTGATGQTGRLLVTELVKQGFAVRAMTRSPDAAGAFGPGVKPVVADVTQPSSLAAAVAGVDTVISTLGARFPVGDNGFEAVDWEGNRALMDAARAAGVRHFILLSAGSAGRDGFPYSWSISPYPWKAKSEAHLRASGLPYTIIAAGGLRDYAGGEKGVLLAPRAQYVSAEVSRGDVAQVLAACVGNAAALGKTITMVNDGSRAVGAWRKDFGRIPADRVKPAARPVNPGQG